MTLSPDAARLLARIGALLGPRTEAQLAARPLAPGLLRRDLGPAGSGLVAPFVHAARAVGVEVHKVDASELESCLSGLVADLDPTRVARLDLLEPVDSVERGKAEVADPFALAATVVRARLAIAATGTVLLEGPRMPPMTAPLVIVVVAATSIVPTLRDALAAGGADVLPSSRLFVTGPSKTADIEGILITGVHGPGRFVVVVVEVRVDVDVDLAERLDSRASKATSPEESQD